MIIMILGELCNFAAYAFVEAIVVVSASLYYASRPLCLLWLLSCRLPWVHSQWLSLPSYRISSWARSSPYSVGSPQFNASWAQLFSLSTVRKNKVSIPLSNSANYSSLRGSLRMAVSLLHFRYSQPYTLHQGGVRRACCLVSVGLFFLPGACLADRTNRLGSLQSHWRAQCQLYTRSRCLYLNLDSRTQPGECQCPHLANVTVLTSKITVQKLVYLLPTLFRHCNIAQVVIVPYYGHPLMRIQLPRSTILTSPSPCSIPVCLLLSLCHQQC